MRKHKYKAWDKTNKEWYMDGNAFDLEYSGNYGDFYFDNDNPHNMREVDLEWVQYTGLKDKNGKEIYEGDIVDNVGQTAHEIAWDEKGFWLAKVIAKNEFYYIGRALSHINEFPSIEVIGNIYENHELLEKQIKQS